MQRNVTDILRDWFFRLPNGYAIQPYNKMELQVLSKVLVENNIDPKPIIESLDQAFLDAKPVEEDIPRLARPSVGSRSKQVQKGLTEIFHESFFAIAYASIIAQSPIETDKLQTIEQFIKYIKQLKSLKDADPIISDIDKYRDLLGYPDGTIRKEKIGSYEFDTMIKDAVYSAERVYYKLNDLYGYPIHKSVERVQGAGESGKKEVADNKVYIVKPDGEEETVLISLKYKKGQFGSLSVADVLKLGFGIEMESKGLIGEIFKDGDGAGIQKCLKIFIDTVNKYIDKVGGIDTAKQGAGKLAKGPAVSEIPLPAQYTDKTGKLVSNISYDQYQADKNIRNVYRKINESMRDADRVDYLRSKKADFNPAVDNWLKKKAKAAVLSPDFVRMSSYILRSDDAMAYLYVAKGGENIHVIPSKTHIEAKSKEIYVDIKREEEEKLQADYASTISLLDISGNAKPGNETLIAVPVRFRWGNGQFNGEVRSISSAPEFGDGFETFFGALGYSDKKPLVSA